MRQILFRGRTKEGRMVYGDLITLNQNGEESKEVCGIRENDLLRTVHICDRDTVGQYTGLTDKNGKKIFEGDVVRYVTSYTRVERNAVVEFGMGCFVARYGINRPALDLVFNDAYYGVEVIGNIYDNPELLEGRT